MCDKVELVTPPLPSRGAKYTESGRASFVPAQDASAGAVTFGPYAPGTRLRVSVLGDGHAWYRGGRHSSDLVTGGIGGDGLPLLSGDYRDHTVTAAEPHVTIGPDPDVSVPTVLVASVLVLGAQ